MTGLHWLVETALVRLSRRPRERRQGSTSGFAAHAVAVLLAGCFVVMATSASFHPRTSSWIAFGFSVGVELATVPTIVIAARRPGRWYALTCALTGGLACWTIVATAGAFAATTARWIAFGSGFGYMLGGLIMLAIHELRRERVIHVLEVRELPAR